MGREVWPLPGAGWIGLDLTSGLFAGEGHIPLATAPEASSAAPVSGAVGPCEVEFHHEMSIARIHEDPRVSLPCTDAQWNRIESLGFQVDREISAGDIRLTMGGEPTFVLDRRHGRRRMDDRGARQTKAQAQRAAAVATLWALRLRRSAPLWTQGKWYPGDAPALGAELFLAQGRRVWRDRRNFSRTTRSIALSAPPMRSAFSETLAMRLGLDLAYVNAAFEDPFYHLQRERQLPINVDPIDNHLEDPGERERIRRVFERGLETPTGYVLPLQRGVGKNGPEWQTGLWMLRGQHLFLVPGDSALGLRLPLPSLPWIAASEVPPFMPLDPTGDLPPLPVPEHFSPAEPKFQARRRGDVRDKKPALGQSAPWTVRTALCVEPRDGRLHIFMPPLEQTEDYLELLAAIEDTAKHLGSPVVIEGYTPPVDYRIKKFSVTPDPGVIEVNIQPAHNWSELVGLTTTLYEDARQARLGTEKFMVDGRHTGTGGGNHFAMGGATPADSPFLRRPDLLRSMLGYWLNHPALSYLFSGMFIGPTSQAPRVDEGRNDNLYELEIAFSQIPNPGGDYCPPWLVDRIFRHILVDLTGNTHRAEFCIDKLYSPDSATGRLGLLEMRGFEMPPHARMSLTQQLLVRALVAWFWREPHRRDLIEWGTQLHDRFMLPYFVAADFRDVLGDLRRAGYPFEEEWFAPHFEFRYPVYGRVNYAGIDIRAAPGAGAGGTSWVRSPRAARRRVLSIPRSKGCR